MVKLYIFIIYVVTIPWILKMQNLSLPIMATTHKLCLPTSTEEPQLHLKKKKKVKLGKIKCM